MNHFIHKLLSVFERLLRYQVALLQHLKFFPELFDLSLIPVQLVILTFLALFYLLLEICYHLVFLDKLLPLIRVVLG
jgi:hypothetical protein